MLQQVMTKPGEIIFREVEIPEVKDDQVLQQILYLIFDYPHKHYTFKYFAV